MSDRKWMLLLIAAVLAMAGLGVLAGKIDAQEPDSVRLIRALDSLEAVLLDQMRGPNVPPPFPDPGDSLPSRRLLAGPMPPIGWGEDVLERCAPEPGEPWNIQVWRATESTDLYPDQNPPDSTLLWVLEQEWDDLADLIVVIPTVGGLQAGALPLGDQTRRHCVYFAGQAAPETLWITGPASWRGVWEDIVYRGFGHIADGRINDGVFRSNFFSFQEGERLYADQLNIAFGSNDQLSFSHGAARHSTIARSMNGPTAGGTSGRGGGMFGGPEGTLCGTQSYGVIVAFEDMRRNPMIGCGIGSPVEAGVILNYNTTDMGRIQRADVQLNFRSAVSIGGPITGCARDRGITWFDQADIEPRSEIYLEEIAVFAPTGCDWTMVDQEWGADHTVFHYSDAGHPALFELHGVGVPHEVSARPLPVIPWEEVEDFAILRSGANFRLTCDGRIERRLNDLSRRIVERVAGRQFAPSPWQTLRQFENATGGPLAYPVGSPCADSDTDGLPDEFEALHGGDIAPGELSPAGRPWMIEYLNGR